MSRPAGGRHTGWTDAAVGEDVKVMHYTHQYWRRKSITATHDYVRHITSSSLKSQSIIIIIIIIIIIVTIITIIIIIIVVIIIVIIIVITSIPEFKLTSQRRPSLEADETDVITN